MFGGNRANAACDDGVDGAVSLSILLAALMCRNRQSAMMVSSCKYGGDHFLALLSLVLSEMCLSRLEWHTLRNAFDINGLSFDELLLL